MRADFLYVNKRGGRIEEMVNHFNKSKEQNIIYCTGSASWPPCLVGHSVILELCRSLMPNMLRQTMKMIPRLDGNKSSCNPSGYLMCDRCLSAAESAKCLIW